MAKLSSKNAVVVVGGYSLSPLAFSYDITTANEIVDVTGFTEGGQNFVPGRAEGNIQASFYWDSLANSANAALYQLGSKAVTIMPEGYALGADAFSMYSTQQNWNPSGGTTGPLVVDGVTFNATGANGRAVMCGQMLAHQTITATTTGTGYGDWTGAAITAPCAGILHVWTPTSTDTYVIKIQHSTALGSGYADLLTFTANGTARTSEIQVAASGTVKRYRRIVATRTGAAADSFSFSVFFWRANA